MTRQDQLMTRRAALRVDIEPPTTETDRLQFIFYAMNTGGKGARDYYWSVFVPTASATTIVSNYIQMGGGHSATIDGMPYREFRGHIDSPLYPSRRMMLGGIDLIGPHPGVYAFLWKLVADDGIFPPDPDFGRFDVEIRGDSLVITEPGERSVRVPRVHT